MLCSHLSRAKHLVPSVQCRVWPGGCEGRHVKDCRTASRSHLTLSLGGEWPQDSPCSQGLSASATKLAHMSSAVRLFRARARHKDQVSRVRPSQTNAQNWMPLCSLPRERLLSDPDCGGRAQLLLAPQHPVKGLLEASPSPEYQGCPHSPGPIRLLMNQGCMGQVRAAVVTTLQVAGLWEAGASSLGFRVHPALPPFPQP